MSTRRNHRATSRSGFRGHEQTANTATAAGHSFGRASARDRATSIRLSPNVSRPSRPPHPSPLHRKQGSGPHNLVLVPAPKFPLTTSYNINPPYLKNAWPYPDPHYSPAPFPVPDPARPETPPSPSLIPLPRPLHAPHTPPGPKTPPTSPSPPPTPPAPKTDLSLEISVFKTIFPHEQHDPLRYEGITLGPRSPPGPPPDCPLPPTPPRPAPRPQPPNPPDTPPPDNDAERLSRIARRFVKSRPEQAEMGGEGLYYYYYYYHAPVVDANGNLWHYTYLWAGSYWILVGPFPTISFPDGLKPYPTPEPEPLPPWPDTPPEKWRGASFGHEPESESQPEPEPTPRPDTPRPDTPEGGWISCGHGRWIWGVPVMGHVPAPQGSQEAKVCEKPRIPTSSEPRELSAPADADKPPPARKLGLRGGCGGRKRGRWWGNRERRVRSEAQEEERMDRRPYENYHQDYSLNEGDTRRYEQNRVHATSSRPYRSALSGGHNPYGELYHPFSSDEELPEDNGCKSLARSGTLGGSPDRGAWDEIDWTPHHSPEHHDRACSHFPELRTSPTANRADSLLLSPFSTSRSSTPSPSGPSSLAFWVTQPGEGGFQINFKPLRRDQRSGRTRRGYSPPPPSRYCCPEVSPRSSPARCNRNNRRASPYMGAQRWQQEGLERSAHRAASPIPHNRHSQHPYAYVVESPWPNRPVPQQELDSEKEARDEFLMNFGDGVYGRSVSLPYGLQALYGTHPTADAAATDRNHPSTPRGPPREADRQRRVSEKEQQQQQKDATRNAPLRPNDHPSSSNSSNGSSNSSGSSTSHNQQDSQGLPYPDRPTDAAIAMIYRSFLRTSLLSGIRATERFLPPPEAGEDSETKRHTGPFNAERLARAGCPSKYLPLLQDMVTHLHPTFVPVPVPETETSEAASPCLTLDAMEAWYKLRGGGGVRRELRLFARKGVAWLRGLEGRGVWAEERGGGDAMNG